jgi:hypothetical protein
MLHAQQGLYEPQAVGPGHGGKPVASLAVHEEVRPRVSGLGVVWKQLYGMSMLTFWERWRWVESTTAVAV